MTTAGVGKTAVVERVLKTYLVVSDYGIEEVAHVVNAYSKEDVKTVIKGNRHIRDACEISLVDTSVRGGVLGVGYE